MILLGFTLFRRRFKILTVNAKIREAIQCLLTGVAIFDISISIIVEKGTYSAEFIRVALIIVFIRSLRESIRRILLVVYDSKEILLMLLTFILFFAFIGCRLFRGTSEGVQQFRTYVDGCWSLLILLTAANFPDVMLPAYHEHKLYAIFFILYLFIGLYFMLYLVIAIFYSNYKNRVDKRINDFIKIREDYLREKFNDFDIDLKGYLLPEECKKLMADLLNLKSDDALNNLKNIDLDKIANSLDSK